MDIDEIIRLIQFIKELKIDLEEVTTEEEKKQGLKVVVATYHFEGKSYKTCRLFYKHIAFSNTVKNRIIIEKHFDSPVYWLDHDVHHWPQGKDHKDLDNRVVGEMANGEKEFKDLLLKLINNDYTGAVQKLTEKGRPEVYGYNLTNNNHLHDLVYLIQATIISEGQAVDKSWIQPLVFRWYNDERVSLANKAIVEHLCKTIEIATKEMKRRANIQGKINLLQYKGQIILQGAPGTGKTYGAEEIAYQLIFNEVLSKDKKERATQLEALEASEQYELVQFHPAYTYEDFVRGIVIENKGDQIAYTTKNKVLGALAEAAQLNLGTGGSSFENKCNDEVFLKEQIERFAKKVDSEIDEQKKQYYDLKDKFFIKSVRKNHFNYYKRTFQNGTGFPFYFDDIVKEILQNEDNDFSYLEKHKDFVWKIDSKYRITKEFLSFLEKQDMIAKYVLVIDEINRANLPSVLGELIYALEYRGRKVESMYAMEDNKRSIIIPPNLYIIGTMNTADRSVGHIDYAIRRRFSFVDVLPNKDVVPALAQPLFRAVSELFISNYDAYYDNPSIGLKESEYLSPDFRPEDVWVGHSYFMAKAKDALQMKLDYEIKPLLKEYVKDGVLSIDASTKIQELHA